MPTKHWADFKCSKFWYSLSSCETHLLSFSPFQCSVNDLKLLRYWRQESETFRRGFCSTTVCNCSLSGLHDYSLSSSFFHPFPSFFPRFKHPKINPVMPGVLNMSHPLDKKMQWSNYYQLLFRLTSLWYKYVKNLVWSRLCIRALLA